MDYNAFPTLILLILVITIKY